MVHRAVAVGFAFVVLACACSTSTPTPASGQPGAGSGGDGGIGTSACSCSVTINDASKSIACGATACVGGQTYACATGAKLSGPGDSCTGSDPDAGKASSTSSSGASCTPKCDGTNCADDGCGGTCSCGTGIACQLETQQCGNGCLLKTGDICVPNSTTANECCGDLYLCDLAVGGDGVCCGNAFAPCQTENDCCAGTGRACRNGKCFFN